MPKANGSSQSEEYLLFLLDYLACPVEHSSPLNVMRDAGGRIVAVRTLAGEYPVVNNIPCMVPDLLKGAGREVTLWQKHQDRMWQEYQDGEEGVFSMDNEVTRYAGEIIALAGEGLFLDIGCGALPLPSYMEASAGHGKWIGIDPFFGDVNRRFPFVQGQGECLPFRDQVFDGVLYASTIYHHMAPRQSLEHSHRVLKAQGQLYIWYEPPKWKVRYAFWKVQRALGWNCHYTRDYPWGFTHRALHSLLEGAGFTLERTVLLCERCSAYQKTCKEANQFLAIARRAGPS